jgi:UMP-CMP kinase
MAHQIPKIFSRRVCQPSSTFQKFSNPISRTFRAPVRNAPARRSYATGESGPKPKPGQSPFKIWPFFALTLAGSGAYMLMVKSRTGTFKLYKSTAPLRRVQLNSRAALTAEVQAMRS